MSQLFVLPKPVTIDANLKLVNGAKAFFYKTGTTTPQTVYQDSDLQTPWGTSVTADSAGVLPPIYLDDSLPPYKLDLQTSAGASLPGYPVDPVNPYVQGIQRTAAETAASVTPKNTLYSPEYIERQGALDGLSVDALTAVNAAISANNRQIRSFDGDFLMSAAPTNQNGIEFRGTGALLKVDSNGGYQQLNSYADLHKYFIGKEYLYRVYQRLIVGGSSPITAFAYGDSTVAGGNGESASVDVQTFLPLLCKVKGLNMPMVCTNRGVAGTKITDMSALGDLSTTSDLFIIKYGINDGLNSLSTRLATFASGLRSKLAAIRAATHGDLASLSIVLVGPNSTNDSPGGRDERWYEQLRGVYRQAARDYHCMYFDTYAWLQDSRPAAGLWLDNIVGGGIGIHPQTQASAWIWGAVIDAMFGFSESVPWRGNYLTNTSGTFDNPTAAALPNTYNYGISIARATAGNGWPEDGVVITTRQLDGPTLQILFPFASGRTIIPKRIADSGGNAWNLWTGQVNALTLANSWVTYGTPYDTPKAILSDSGIVTVSAIIKSGTTTSGTTLTTLPAGLRPSATVGPFMCVTSAGNTNVIVSSAGVVSLNAAGDATYTSLQFSFRAA